MTTAERAIHDKLKSRSYRLNNLYWIEDKQGKKVKFRLNWAQRAFLKSIWWLNVILKARQLGMSTLMAIYILDTCLFSANKTCGVIDRTDEDAKKKLGKMRFAYDNLDSPDYCDNPTSTLGAGIKEALRITRANDHELEFSNGSKVWAGTSLRGGTLQVLHISELGYIAANNPKKAEEIRSGALNTVHAGSVVVIESTHEGGKVGLNYEMIRTAQRSPDHMTTLDWRFHFFAWWQDPDYSLPESAPLKPHTVEYFGKLSAELQVTFTHGQMLWYERKADTQGYAMKKEFPSTPGEALTAISNGAIYGSEMANLRAKGRIRPLEMDANWPLYTFWDLGLSDYGVMWLIQPIGIGGFVVLDWFEIDGKSAAFFADHVRRWEAKWGRPIAKHFLPHDANTRDRGTGKSYVGCLQDAGITNVSVVPRTPDTWIGVGYVRDVLPHCWFHEENCDQPRNREGQTYRPGSEDEEFPSGIACLEGYSKDINPAALREMPKHDQFSHSADAFRTFGEAWRLGMVNTEQGGFHKAPQAINGAKPRARR